MHSAIIRISLFLIALGFLAYVPADAQRADNVKAGYKKILFQVGDDSGKRHLVLANSLEDRKVLSQAIEQFQLAADRAQGPKQVLAAKAVKMLREMPQDRAENYYHHPTKKERIRYRGKAAAEHMKDRKGWMRLAEFAGKHPEVLMNEAMEWYGKLIEDSREFLEIDEDKRIVLREGTVPDYISNEFLDSKGLISINGKPYLRTGVLENIMGIDELHGIESKKLVILFQEGREELDGLLKMGGDLHSLLKSDLGDSPDQPLTLLILSGREAYETCCSDADEHRYKTYQGFVDRMNRVAVVCTASAEGGGDTFHVVECIALRELVRLFHYRITEVEMPDWFLEGLAETYGGRGTFECSKGRTRFKGMAERSRIEELQSSGALELEKFLFNPQITSDKARTERFYTQAWAFRRFLNTPAGSRAKKKIEGWEEETCSRKLDRIAAQERLHMTLIKDMAKLEKGFSDYLAKL